MSDRELLELAAKAVGAEWVAEEQAWWFNGSWWNPRTDHGDRYRLARDCKMILDFDGGEVKWQFDGEEYKRAFRFTPGNDAEEADAVINAAAEIGRNMG